MDKTSKETEPILLSAFSKWDLDISTFSRLLMLFQFQIVFIVASLTPVAAGLCLS